jgi:integrase
MRKLLTDRSLKALKPKSKQYTCWDTSNPHFAVRVSGKGKIAFVVMRRPAGSPRPVRVTLGHYPTMTLEKAREEASKAIAELLAGKKPTEERKRERERQAEKDATTFAGVAKRYKDFLRGNKARTAEHVAKLIDRDLVSRWDGRPIASITKRDVIDLVDWIKDHRGKRAGERVGGPAAARQALVYARRIFKFAQARDLIEHSPADLIDSKQIIGVKKPRQRVLTDEEIRVVWNAVAWNTAPGIEIRDRGRWPTAPFVRLLLLLGVRRGELGKARWRDVDLDKAEWLIAPEHAKTGKPHVVWLPHEAVRIFASLPRFAGGDLIFTNDGVRPIGGLSHLKQEIDHKSGVTGWTLHDLRRTARTNWSRLGIAPHVSELMLGHARKGIEGTYDHWSYLPERREALERWAQHIHEITSPPPPEDGKVVKLRA